MNKYTILHTASNEEIADVYAEIPRMGDTLELNGINYCVEMIHTKIKRSSVGKHFVNIVDKVVVKVSPINEHSL